MRDIGKRDRDYLKWDNLSHVLNNYFIVTGIIGIITVISFPLFSIVALVIADIVFGSYQLFNFKN